MSQDSAYFTIDNLNGKHGLKEIKRALDTLHGVTSVSVNTENHRVAVDFDDTGVSREQIERKLTGLGYQYSIDSGDEYIM